MDTIPVVELENLKVKLGRREILHGITCRLGVSGTGKAVGLLGPNGAGKSTLILTLLGFLRPSAGRARILGLDCRRNMGEARSRIGYMPENDSFVGEMTAVTFLRQMAELSGLPPKAALEKAHEVLFHVGLGEARYRELRTYSYGMKQMAKLAQAIVHGPELVVLDEPTNGLDPAARRRMLKLVAEMKEEQGMNVLVCSHLLRDIEQVCDEAVILKDGVIVHHCNLEEERRSNRSFVELEVTGDDRNLRMALPEIGAEGVSEGGGRWRIVLPAGVEVEAIWGLAARQNLLVRKLTHRRDTLEEIFLKAMGHLAHTPGEAHSTAQTRAAGTRRRTSSPSTLRRAETSAMLESTSAAVSLAGTDGGLQAGISAVRGTPHGALDAVHGPAPLRLARGSISSGWSLLLTMAAFVWPLLCAGFVYLTNHVELLQGLEPEFREFIQVDGRFFSIFMYVQAGFAVFLAALAGPGLIAPDLANNALPLYFSRPLTRWSYALARLTVIVGMLSVVTWIPGLLLFGLQVGLAGGWWFLANWTLGAGMVAGFLLWLLVLSLVAMASSAYVKWRVVAGAVSLAFFFILTGVSEMIDEVFRVTWGHVLDPAWAVNRVWCTLLGVDPPDGPGAGASMLALAGFVLLLVLVIERKLRPVEVVR